MATPKETRTIEIIVNGQQANASLKDMDAAAAVLWNQLRKISADDPGRAKLKEDYQALKGKITEVKNELNGVSQAAGGMKQLLTNAFSVAIGGGIEGVISKVFELGKSIFDTTAKFQTYESVMTNALGDKSKAQQALADIQQMAAKTPFSVDELTGSFIKFVNRGLQPSMAEMTKLADIAASQGKSFDQLTEAALDAAGGEFERLKEFGIKASKSGDQVSFSFKGITQSVKNTPEAINGAIMAFGSMKGIAGSTAAISATLEGQLSNLGDSADQLKIKVGEGLKPVFTTILTLFGRFIDWIGRFAEAAAPLKSMFTEIGTIVNDLYQEVAAVLEGLGLFSSKTNTVKFAVEALKVVLTVVLIPVRALFQATKGLVDLFIDWYNKSELLRGILGGLGAVIVSLFTTIKDDAIKILGGVGDIIVGIFTLDKNKIIAGFKSALSATADVALSAGERAAADFLKGYEANKNNRITRKVNVETSETTSGGGQVGIDLKSDASAGDAADEKKRLAAEKKAAAEAARRLKAAEKAERELQEMLYNEAQVAYNKNATLREKELADIEFDALRKELTVTGSARERAAQIALIEQEAQNKKTAKQAQFDKEDRDAFLKSLQQKLDDIEAGEVEDEAAIQEAFEEAVISEKARTAMLWDVRMAAANAKLSMIESTEGKESELYRKAYKEREKLQKDANVAQVAEDKKLQKAKQEITKQVLSTASSALQTTIDLLFQDTQARKEHHALYLALSSAKIIAEGIAEVQAIWSTFSEMGPVGIALAAVQTAVSVVRSGMALSKLNATGAVAGYAKGGATGTGSTMMGSPMGMLLEMSGLGVAGNGKLTDNSGFAIAGVVHEDEYVVPKWMRADPQVAAVEQWLEARRMRGYFEGGATTSSGATLPAANPAPTSDSELTYAVLVQLLEQSKQQTQQLADVRAWKDRLTVALHLGELDDNLSERKQVQLENGIRA